MEIIEDKELRELFKAETEEHTNKMEEGLLALEKAPRNSSLVEEILREAHSMKGAARMLGVTNVETLSHRFEDLLKEASQGGKTLDSRKIDQLAGMLDDLRKMANEAVTGKPSGITLAQALARLDGETSSELSPHSPSTPEDVETITADPNPADGGKTAKEPEPSSDRAKPPEEFVSATEPVSEGAIAPDTITAKGRSANNRHHAGHRDDYHISTIRVEPKKLDVLMTLIGELIVAKTHIERHLNETEKIYSLWGGVKDAIEQSQIVEHDEQLIATTRKIGTDLDLLRQAFFEDSSSLNRITEALEEGIRGLRLLPLSTLFNLFVRSVRDLSRELGKEVELIVDGGEVTADKQFIEMMKDPLMHLIRNAIYHGIEDSSERLKAGKDSTARIQLKGRRTSTHIVIEVEDDGKGLDLEVIKATALKRKVCQPEELELMSDDQINALIFKSGFSTNSIVTDVSGRGVGLDVVKTSVEQLKGQIEISSTTGVGCRFTVQLPLTLATTRVFLVVANGVNYALPVEFVRKVRYISEDEIFLVENREAIALNGDAISVSWLTDLLEYSSQSLGNDFTLQPENKDRRNIPCLFLSRNNQQLGLFVDELLDELEVILKPPGALLQRVRNVSGVTILGSGDICVVLNPPDLMKTVENRRYSITSTRKGMTNEEVASQEKRPLILLAEDSITTRTKEKRILENAGYEVVTAVDGQKALNTLPTRPFDALISDVEMPNMSGLSLAENVRKLEGYEDFPIILVTSLSSEQDIRRGMEVGADAYITKASFNQAILLDTLRRLI